MNPIDEKYYDHQQGPIRFPYFPKPQIAENKSEINGNLQPKVTDLAEPRDSILFVYEETSLFSIKHASTKWRTPEIGSGTVDAYQM